jgi:hypothetical protein
MLKKVLSIDTNLVFVGLYLYLTFLKDLFSDNPILLQGIFIFHGCITFYLLHIMKKKHLDRGRCFVKN